MASQPSSILFTMDKVGESTPYHRLVNSITIALPAADQKNFKGERERLVGSRCLPMARR